MAQKQIDHEARLVPVDELKLYGRNPRRGDVEAIRESLRVNGQYRPLVVRRKTSEVLAGNHTLKAARAEGWSEVWATFVDVTAPQAKRIVLVDNRSNDLASYDDEALVELIGELPDLAGSGYDEDAVRDLVARTVLPNAERPSDEAPEPPEDPETKPGDLYVLGDHRLLCGDATSAIDVERLMGGEQAALVFTDPPYGVDYDGGTKKREKLAADQHGTDVYAAVLPMVLTASEKKAPIYLWHAYTEGPAAVSALRDAGYDVRSLILWVKNQAQFGALSAHYKQQHEPCLYACRKGVAPYWHGPTNETTVWEHDRATSNDFHPTQKPIALAERAIGNSSVAGALVLDLFGGSGSTLMACEATARRARLMEIDPRYCDVIVRRWEEHTGRKAEQADGP